MSECLIEHVRYIREREGGDVELVDSLEELLILIANDDRSNNC